jgi:hypothetical protein
VRGSARLAADRKLHPLGTGIPKRAAALGFGVPGGYSKNRTIQLRGRGRPTPTIAKLFPWGKKGGWHTLRGVGGWDRPGVPGVLAQVEQTHGKSSVDTRRWWPHIRISW